MTLEEFVKLDNDAKRTFYVSSGWNDFVMSQLDSDEMVDGYPKAIGLRRVAEVLLGDIIDSKPVDVFPVTGNGLGRATVSYLITFKWFDGTVRSHGDVADVWDGNINDDFIAFAMPTASTRAEARCLKKALKLKVCAAEEITDKIKPRINQKYTNEDSISKNQISFLDKRCRDCDVDLIKFLNSGEEKYGRIEQVSKAKASEFIKTLNEVNNERTVLKESFKGYKEDWRNL